MSDIVWDSLGSCYRRAYCDDMPILLDICTEREAERFWNRDVDAKNGLREALGELKYYYLSPQENR